MKRTTILIAVLSALALVTAACGGQVTDETPDTGEVAEFTTLEEGVLTVGSDIPFPPFEFEENGDLVGFDVDLVEEIASRLGLTTEWVATPFDTIFTQLAAGQFDLVASATTITPEREEMVNFTTPYYAANQALTVNAEATPDVGSVDDLTDGHTVAVQEGTTGQMWAEANLPAGVEVRAFPAAPDTYNALEAGNVTAVIFDEPSAAEEAKNRPGLEVVDVIETGELYGFAVNPANQPLLDAVNTVLEEMIADGTYQQIYDQWFPDAPGGSIAD